MNKKELKNLNNIEKILDKCIKALKGEISLDEINLTNNVYKPLISEIKKGRYDRLTVEIYSYSADLILKKAINLLDETLGKKIDKEHKIFKKFLESSDDELSSFIKFYQEIPQFDIPITNKDILKAFNELIVNKSVRKSYVKNIKKIEFYLKNEEPVKLIEEDIKNLYKRIKEFKKKKIKFNELLIKKNWDEASNTIILLGYLVNENKIDLYQENFPNGEIYIEVID